MRTLRTKYPYSVYDRVRDENTNKSVGLQFPPTSRSVTRTARPRITSVSTANTAKVIFEQIYLIIDKNIKNAYFHICVILNTVKKKCLNNLPARILYRNNNPSDLKQNLDQHYIYILDTIVPKLYKPKTSNKNPPPKKICIINF